MATIHKNHKGFKIIEMSSIECLSVFDGGLGICDKCLSLENGFYIPVLVMYYCKSCYEKWNSTAINYIMDRPFEAHQFEIVAKKLNLI